MCGFFLFLKYLLLLNIHRLSKTRLGRDRVKRKHDVLLTAPTVLLQYNNVRTRVCVQKGRSWYINSAKNFSGKKEITRDPVSAGASTLVSTRGQCMAGLHCAKFSEVRTI